MWRWQPHYRAASHAGSRGHSQTDRQHTSTCTPQAGPPTRCQNSVMMVHAGLCLFMLYLKMTGSTGLPATKAPVLNCSMTWPEPQVPSGAMARGGMAGLLALRGGGRGGRAASVISGLRMWWWRVAGWWVWQSEACGGSACCPRWLQCGCRPSLIRAEAQSGTTPAWVYAEA